MTTFLQCLLCSLILVSVAHEEGLNITELRKTIDDYFENGSPMPETEMSNEELRVAIRNYLSLDDDKKVEQVEAVEPVVALNKTIYEIIEELFPSDGDGELLGKNFQKYFQDYVVAVREVVRRIPNMTVIVKKYTDGRNTAIGFIGDPGEDGLPNHVLMFVDAPTKVLQRVIYMDLDNTEDVSEEESER